jgi:hypothetical protein
MPLVKVWAVISAVSLPVLLFAYRWFLLKTDVLVGYGWKWNGPNFYPSFDIRNRSSSRTYVLANITYTRNDGKELLSIDNKSIWGKEIRPGTISYLEPAPVPEIYSPQECSSVQIKVRLQNGREFKAQGPGQLYTGLRKKAFALRMIMEKASLPLAD